MTAPTPCPACSAHGPHLPVGHRESGYQCEACGHLFVVHIHRQVFHERSPLAHCPTEGACPSCREGYGHYNGDAREYTETVESAAANAPWPIAARARARRGEWKL